MAFEKMTDDMNIISSLGDEPNEDNGLSASALKAKFDKAGTLAKEAINKLISALGASTAAGNIGFASSTQVPADNVQDAIDNVQAQLAGVALNTVPNGSIGTVQLANKAVTQKKLGDLDMPLLTWVEKTDETSGYAVVSGSWPFVREGHLLPIRWYGGNLSFTRGSIIYVKDSAGTVCAEISIPIAGSLLYFNLCNTANYLLLCTSDHDGYNIPPSFTFPDCPTWSDIPEGTMA